MGAAASSGHEAVERTRACCLCRPHIDRPHQPVGIPPLGLALDDEALAEADDGVRPAGDDGERGEFAEGRGLLADGDAVRPDQPSGVWSEKLPFS
jgi:hypothetical protein